MPIRDAGVALPVVADSPHQNDIVIPARNLRARSMISALRRPRLRRAGAGPAPPLKLNTGSGEYQVMSGTLINLIIQIISGAIGGNVAGNAAKNIDLGTL